MKKLLLLAMTALIAFTSGAYDFIDGGIAYEIISEGSHTARVVAKSGGYSGSVNIPIIANGYWVVGIDDNAFKSCTSLTQLSMPDGIEQIGTEAFRGCTNLTDIEIPASVLAIGKAAFDQCGLQHLTFNARNCAQFADGQSPFRTCPIEELVIGDDAIVIPDSMMTGITTLQRVTVGESVTSLGLKPFVGCISLKEVYYNAIDYDHYDQNNAPTYWSNGESVRNILFNSKCPLEKFILGENVEYLPYGVVSSSTVRTLVIPDKLKELEYYSLALDTLEILHIGASLKRLNGLPSFYWLKQLTLNENNRYMTLEDSVLYDKAKTEILFYPNYRSNPVYDAPHTLRYIYGSEFWGHPYIRILNLPASIQEICCWRGDDAYIVLSGMIREMNLEAINIADSNPYYSSIDGVLFNADHTKLLVYPQSKPGAGYVVPDGVKVIGGSAFRDNKYLQSVILPTSVTRIEARAFERSKSLTNAILGGAQIIGDCAFQSCTNLQSVSVSTQLQTIERRAFNNNKNMVSINLPETMRIIDEYAFNGCSKLQLNHLPDSLMVIGKVAFEGCSSITELNVPKCLILMGEQCFGYPSSSGFIRNILKYADDGVGYVGDFVYHYQGSLGTTSVTIRPGTRGIAGAAFRNAKYLEEINIPESVESVEQNAFAGTAWLANQKPTDHVIYAGKVAYCHYGFDNEFYYSGTLNIKEGTKGIGSDILKYVNDNGGLSRGYISAVNLPSTLTNVASRAFDYYFNLAGKLELPEGLKCAGYIAFDTPLINEVVWPSTLTVLGSSAFVGVGGKGSFESHWSGTDGNYGNAEFLKFHIRHKVPPIINIHTFYDGGWGQGYPFTGTLFVPRGSAKLYKVNDVWGKFKHIIEEDVPGQTAPGDMDGSGIIDVEDVNALINIILKVKETIDYPGDGDMNNDGIIDVEDVNALINIILKLD